VLDNNGVFAARLPKDDRTIRLLSDLFVQEHIFPALDKRVQTYAGAHKLFKNIESGFVRVYGAFYQEKLMGVCFGHLEEGTSDFCTHLAFLRHTKALEGCASCAAVMVEDYKREGIIVKNIVGYIPDYNRAALRIARLYGCEDCGIDETKTIIKDNYIIPCRVMKINLEVK
jgi:hypothetical protein